MRLKNLLTFLVLLSVSLGMRAADISGTGISGATDNSSGKKVQTLVISEPGALATWVAAHTGNYDSNNPYQGFGGSDDFEVLEISGTLNAADLAAINSATCAGFSRFPKIDMSRVTLAEGVTAANVCGINFGPASFDKNGTTISGTGATYVRLPNGMTSAEDVASMGTLKDNGKNSNLLVVGATDNVATNTAISQIAMHSFQSNNVANFSDALLGGYNAIGSSGSTAKTSVKMAGRYGNEDLCKDNKNLFGVVKSFDFTNATFDPYTIESLTLNAYPDGSHPYARGPQGDGVNANDPFADVSETARTTMTLTNYQTSALYFVSGYKYDIESIVFPTGNTDIPPTILSDASKLTEVNIPSHYTLIGHEAFLGSGISQVTIGHNIRTIEAGAFSRCTKLEDVKFETGIIDQVYGPSVFSNCQKMKHIVFPEGIKTLGAEMFSLSAYVESVRLPESLINIGSGCFMNCHSLTSITIPQNVKKIGQQAFALVPLRDVYLTCTDPDKLPLIWSMGNKFDNADVKSTFGGNTMNNITSTGGMDATKAASMDWDEAVLEYYFVNGIAVLHFPKELAWDVRANISKKYGWKSHDGYGLPNRNNTQYTNGDFGLRADELDLEVGGNGQGLYTQNGWAQFVLMKEYDPNTETVVYTKEYDDVWYTMCYPFDLTDEQLATAFNEGFNIVDFSAVEIRTNELTQKKELILHFNNIAKTTYKDQDGIVYTDLGKGDDGYHTFKASDGSLYTHVAFESSTLSQAAAPTYAKGGDKANGIKYIEGYLAEAGHPYMIHPNLGTSTGGTKVPCHFSGITWKPQNERDNLYLNMARTIDIGEDKTTDNYSQVGYPEYSDQNQTYTFQGYWRACKEGDESFLAANPEPTFTLSRPVKPIKPAVAPTRPEGEEVTQDGTLPTPVVNDPSEDTETYPKTLTTWYETKSPWWTGGYNGAMVMNGEAIIAHTISELAYTYDNGATYTDNQGPLYQYFGKNSFTANEFNKLKSDCQAYKTAIDLYNSYITSYAQYATQHRAYVQWENYRNEMRYYNMTQEEFDADYNAAVQAYESALSDYNSAHKTWAENMKSHLKLIPKNAYFLGRKKNAAGEYIEKPKFYRETADDSTPRSTGIWTQYSAIIMPSPEAIEGIENEIEPTISSGIKGYNIAFNEDYEGEFTPSEIKDIVAKAEEKGQKVEYMNIVYSINGEIVGHGSASLNNLPQGMYIINGKKYLVK